MNVDRLTSDREITAAVALDTIDVLANRVRNLLAAGRRMTLVTRYTWDDAPPTVTPGLTLDDEPRCWCDDLSAGFVVRLKPGVLCQFGFAAYAGEHDTEADVWRRYHDGKSIADNYFERRRNVTEVRMVGGLPGSGPARDEQLTIRAWNRDGVCEETIVAFDYDTRTVDAPIGKVDVQ